MIHYEPVFESPYFGINSDNDRKYEHEFMRQWEQKRKCPICGEEFPVYDSLHHVYTIDGSRGSSGRRLVCSWHCMRRWEREIKKPIPHASKLNWRNSIKDARERREECLKRIELYEERQKGTTGAQSRLAGKNAARWRSELKEVDEYLEVKGETE